MPSDSGNLDSRTVLQLLEHTPGALVALTAEQRILTANRRARALLGHDAGTLDDRAFAELLAAPARPAFAALAQAYLADRIPREDVRLRGLHHDRGELDLLLSLDHVHVAGALVLLAGLSAAPAPRDLAAEAHDKAAEARSRALLDAIPDFMIRVNRHGEYLDFKPPRDARRMPPPPALGSRLQDNTSVPLPLRTLLMGAIQRVLETGETEILEYMLDANGEVFYHEARLSKSGPDEIVSIIRDVTERTRAEIRIKELNQHLEQRNRELEDTIQELESFSYSVSHDLRAPLRAIDGFSQAIAEDYLGHIDPAALRMLGRIRAASQRMGQIIDDLLNLARIKRSYLNRKPLDLSALAAEVAEGLRTVYPAHPVELEVAPGMTIVADRSLMRTLLENLLGNAWKYTSRRERARVEVGTLTQDGEQVYFVRDNGAGFDMKYAHKLFGPFQRLHAVDAFPGTGIGLATAAQIIRLHGGRIWAEGAEDQGATFYFTVASVDAT